MTTTLDAATDRGEHAVCFAGSRPCGKRPADGTFAPRTGGTRERRRLTLVAAGAGIAPIRAMLEDLDFPPGEVVVIYRAGTEQDLMFRDELDMLATLRGLRVVYLPGHRLPGHSSWLPARFSHLLDDDALRQIVPDIADHDVFISGPQPWMDAVRDAALLSGVPSEQLHMPAIG